MKTNVWLRECIYKRVTPKGQKPGNLSSMITFFTSAFWVCYNYYTSAYLRSKLFFAAWNCEWLLFDFHDGWIHHRRCSPGSCQLPSPPRATTIGPREHAAIADQTPLRHLQHCAFCLYTQLLCVTLHPTFRTRLYHHMEPPGVVWPYHRHRLAPRLLSGRQ